MKRFKRLFGLFLPVLILMTMLTGTAQAALLDFGPIVPEVVGSTPPNIRSGFPLWFRDTNRVPLQLCLEEVPGCLFAAVDRPNLNAPLAFPNIPDELFYYSATALIPNANPLLNDHLLFAGVEMNFFDNGDGTYDQVGFTRVRIRIDSTVAGNYTVTTPWKQYLFTVDQATIDATAGRRVINATEDIGLGPDGVFDGVTLGNVGPFAYSQGAPFVTAAGSFLGDNTPRPLVGSPNNIFLIEGPAGFTTVSTNLFAVTGKLYDLAPVPTPLTVDRLTYSRDAAGVQINTFVTTQPLSNQTNPAAAFPLNFALTGALSTLEVTAPGIPTQSMTTNTAPDGKFFSTTGVFSFQGNLPADATVTNTADTPDTIKSVPLVDEVKITNVSYSPLNSTLTVSAQSLDTVANPTLSVFIPGMSNPLGTLSNGQLSVAFPVNDNSGPTQKTYNIPPATITVTSDFGGSTTAPVNSFLIQSTPPIAPTLISPSSTSTSATPTFSWYVVPGATNYDLFTDISGVQTTVSFTAAGNCNAFTCSVTPATALANGASVYWVARAKSTTTGLTGEWSTPLTFVVTIPVVPTVPTLAPALVSPSVTVTTTTPTYVWNVVAGATDYDLFFDINGVQALVQFTATGNCTATSCSAIPPAATLPVGANVYWVVRARNAAGVGPWSAPLTFTHSSGLSVATLISPTGTSNTTPTYSWNVVAGATDYDLFTSINGGVTQTTTPFTAAGNCTVTTCSVTPATTLTAGDSVYWIIRPKSNNGIGSWSAPLTFVAN